MQGKSNTHFKNESYTNEQLLSTQENMFGTVKLIPPPNCSVWHGGVSIGLDTSLSFFESLTTTETKDLEVVIEEAGYIS